MMPYQGLFFFYILGVALLFAILLGLLDRPIKYYGLLVTIGLIAWFFSEKGQLTALLSFYLWQMTLCVTFFHIKKKSIWKLGLSLILAILPLIFVKIGEVFPLPQVLQLLGVSYMTFRSVQVLIDSYNGSIKKLSVLNLSYFLLFFPSVASGPIDRYQRFCKDLNRKQTREEYIKAIGRGVWKLFLGAFSAIVLSGIINQRWLQVLPNQGFFYTISYMYGYTLYLFFNFAGYSSMAIGTAYILGISLQENFNMPFLSVDMKDFWARWHISLSTWMRDYLYSTFVKYSLKTKMFRKPRTASYIGYILIMMTMGLWHGFTIRYLLYGVYHSLLMCLNEVLDLHWKPFRKMKQSGWTQVACVIVTFHLYSFGLLLFSGRLI